MRHQAVLVLAAAVALPPTPRCVRAQSSLPESTLNRLTLPGNGTVQLKPGESHPFVTGLYECCVRFAPIKARTVWSVTPQAGARIDSVTGAFRVDSGTPAGSVFDVTANVERGRRVLTAKVYVYTPASNPLAGYWRQASESLCGTDQPLAPAMPIRELYFGADGRFTVTWQPFETYRDYWGTYTYDVKAGRLEFLVTGGNYVPRDFHGTGSFSVDTAQRLILRAVSLG